MSADWYRKHNRYNFLPRRYQAADSGSSLMGGNAYASMQHRSADKLLYIQSPIRRSPARMDCGVFGFDKVWAFSLSTSRKNFILLLWRACSLYGRAFLVCAPWVRSNGWKSRTRLGNEEVYSRTARVSIVRWNLKEAVSKLLVRRTEITYEARFRLVSLLNKTKP